MCNIQQHRVVRRRYCSVDTFNTLAQMLSIYDVINYIVLLSSEI